MANKELDKLRKMSVSDLNKNLETIYKEQFEDNLKLKTGQLNEIHKIKLNRKQVARIKTVMSEKNNAGDKDAK
jgi:large subunit ribosomal protein L29|tara:strand:+ start:635 stop:853 length:219 start_codon:yes stop_codon:yes gene_type:complete